MISFWKYHKSTLLLVSLSALLYWLFAYDLVRTDFTKLLALYTVLFAITLKLSKLLGNKINTILMIGLGLRLIFILAIPNLSQDFYRFIWDGYLNLRGINPYLFTPNELISTGIDLPNEEVLFKGMGELSATNYSNYPPLNQWCFSLANLFPGESILSSVIGLRLIIILADIGILILGSKILSHLGLPKGTISWFFLNPFILIELTGNLHFEGVMLFFLLLSFYLLTKKQLLLSAVAFGLSISVKLIPLMFLPLFFSYFISKHEKQNRIEQFLKLISYYTISVLVFVGSFIPFLSSEFMGNYSKTIGLWFGNFEFNASFYYVFRSIGYWITGYNQIGIIGKILPILSTMFILYRSFFTDNSRAKTLFRSMLFVLSFYLLMSTTVHPWYISTMILLGIFSNINYPVIWSLAIVLSYYAYGQTDFKENLTLVFIEYAIIFIAIYLEIFRKKKFNLLRS